MARTEKQFFVSGYAINVRGYTHSAKATVFARDSEQAVMRAAAQLRWDGMTYFRALTVREIPSVAVSVKGAVQ